MPIESMGRRVYLPNMKTIKNQPNVGKYGTIIFIKVIHPMIENIQKITEQIDSIFSQAEIVPRFRQ